MSFQRLPNRRMVFGFRITEPTLWKMGVKLGYDKPEINSHPIPEEKKLACSRDNVSHRVLGDLLVEKSDMPIALALVKFKDDEDLCLSLAFSPPIRGMAPREDYIDTRIPYEEPPPEHYAELQALLGGRKPMWYRRGSC